MSIQRGRLTLDWNTSATRMTTSHDATEDVVGRGPTPVVHEQAIALVESRISAEYGVRDGLGVAVVLPYRIVDTTIAYVDTTGDEVALTAPNIHHRTQTLSGFADAWVLGRRSLARGAWTFDLRLGVSLPLGKTEEDPFRLGDMGRTHEHVQLGTGTVNPIAGVEVGRAFAAWRLGAWALTQQIVYENAKGYQAGDRYAGGVRVASPLGTQRWSFLGGVEAQGETTERWSGMAYAEDGNRGRVDVLAALGVGVQATDWLQLGASVRVPVFTHLVGGELSYPVLVALGATGSFELFGGGKDEHADGHAEGAAAEVSPPVADFTGLDVVELAGNGEAVPLAPVPGVVTVFDFWAPWCQPCKVLDRELATVMRGHPSAIALRKVNIVDWDSPAAAKYLAPAGHDLPHVKVFAADGSRAFEQSGDPRVLAAKIAALLSKGRAADPRP